MNRPFEIQKLIYYGTRYNKLQRVISQYWFEIQNIIDETEIEKKKRCIYNIIKYTGILRCLIKEQAQKTNIKIEKANVLFDIDKNNVRYIYPIYQITEQIKIY